MVLLLASVIMVVLVLVCVAIGHVAVADDFVPESLIPIVLSVIGCLIH